MQANEKKSQLYCADKNVDIVFENGVNYALFDNQKCIFSLWGLHQKQNLSLVIKAVDILKNLGFKISFNNFKISLETVFLPARFQYFREKNLILDGSHNVDAAKKLRENLDFYFPGIPRKWIYGTLSTKEYDKIVNILFQPDDQVFLCKFKNSLSVDVNKIKEKINHVDNIKIKNYSKTANTLKTFSKNRLMIITGSFYMIGELFNPY